MTKFLQTAVAKRGTAFLEVASDVKLHLPAETPRAGSVRIRRLLQKPVVESIGRQAYEIAMFLWRNHGGYLEMKEVVDRLKLAAKCGVVEAYKELGVIYYLGDGVDRDYEEAGKWLRKCGERGFYAVQFHLYRMLVDKKLNPAFDGEAEYWFEKAETCGYGRNSYNAFPY
jgi:TPR repeat protein